jgi:hypothetical protein
MSRVSESRLKPGAVSISAQPSNNAYYNDLALFFLLKLEENGRREFFKRNKGKDTIEFTDEEKKLLTDIVHGTLPTPRMLPYHGDALALTLLEGNLLFAPVAHSIMALTHMNDKNMNHLHRELRVKYVEQAVGSIVSSNSQSQRG